ncbi:MAG: DUF928 domain-containing protein [Spirulina sp.]
MRQDLGNHAAGPVLSLLLLGHVAAFSLPLHGAAWGRENPSSRVAQEQVLGTDARPQSWPLAAAFEDIAFEDRRGQPLSPAGPGPRGGTRAYQPPADPGYPRRTTGGGTRGGCDGRAATSLTAMAPQAHIGQTASLHPTLTWYIADTMPVPLELQIYRYTSEDPTDDRLEPVAFFDLGRSQTGWMTFTLPDDLPPLVVGETYRWKIIAQCSESQPSRNRIDEADLQVVAMPTDIEITGDSSQQAQQYAEAGLWYDAIALLAQPPLSPVEVSYRRDLVLSLADLEAENPNDPLSLLSYRLRNTVNPTPVTSE